MADTRTIAEIIGSDYMTGCDCQENETYTPDDLLAFLGARGLMGSIDLDRLDGGPWFNVELSSGDGETWLLVSAPTILAALEAAVREVSE